ncbi:MAG: hypothetical protein HUK02_06705 [Bacteroidaceae bacterium]|nr:hypothetical protein [Bacteroidaceae bacterium]
MKKILFLSVVAAVAMTSCKKLGALSSDDFKVTPTPLVAISGEVPATISATFPEKYLKKKAVVTCTPVLKYAGGEAVGNSATFQGEKVEGNATTVNYKLGGTYNMKSNFRYTDEMLKSDLYMRFNAAVGKKQVSLPDVKIGYGVLATSALLGRCLDSDNAALAADNFQRVISQKQEANIKFLIGQSVIRTSELQSVSLKDLVAVLKEINDNEETRALETIEVSAYASPDGAYRINERLAERRQDVSSDYLSKQLKKLKMDADINTKYTAEDWDGFQQLVAASNLQDKQVILSVLSMYQDPEERETQIRNMSEIYTDIKSGILPELRRARLIVNYEVIGRSDDQILEQYQTDARQLSVEEMVYAANMLVETPAEQKAWNKRIIELYPNDFRAYNNLASLAYAEQNYDEAAQWLQKAKQVNNNAPEVNTNQALMALRDGDVQKAETLLAMGSGAKTYNSMLGALNIAKGNYTQAAINLAKADTNTEALAELLNNDYVSASQTLDAIKKGDATTDYLRAILAARTENPTLLASSLKAAFEKDASLKSRAKNDLEFTKYASILAGLVK